MAVDRPIIFSAPMVRALLAGTKTQTRRLLNPQPQRFEVAPGELCDLTLHYGEGEPWPRITLGRVITRQEVRYRPGMRLWVRENWKPHSLYAHMKPCDMPQAHVFYAADNAYAPSNTPWVPSIHMPRWASRLTLTVTDVRVQRLQEISRGDALDEGCPFPNMAAGPDPCDWYRDLWNQLHGAGGWDANPEVVAVSFTVERRNIGAADPRAAALAQAAGALTSACAAFIDMAERFRQRNARDWAERAEAKQAECEAALTVVTAAARHGAADA